MKQHPQIKQRQRGLDEAGHVESFLVLQKELPVGQVSYIASESAPLRALAQVNREIAQEVERGCPEQKIATADLDSTIIEPWRIPSSLRTD